MGCIALVRCVLVLRCGLAVVVWFLYAGLSTAGLFNLHTDTTPLQPNHNVTPTHIEPGTCKLRYTTSEYIQEILSKYNTRQEHSINIRHRSSQYLQKHAF